MLALQKSTDGGQTFTQVQLLTHTDGYNNFTSIKDSQNNTYVMCRVVGEVYGTLRIVKVSASNTISVAEWSSTWAKSGMNNANMILSRDEKTLFFLGEIGDSTQSIYSVSLDPFPSTFTGTISIIGISVSKFAIYKDQYIWVASGTTVKIYDYDTKAELASVNNAYTPISATCATDNTLYSITGGGFGRDESLWKFTYAPPVPPSTSGVITILPLKDFATLNTLKQLLIDRFGDLIILTNTGTASTLLKYSNTGELIDTVNLSVAGILGVGRGAYGLQVYSHKDANGIVTDCYCYFSNDMGTWKTAPTIAQEQVFGAITKIRNNGETTYGDDWGGDNNYSVRC